MASRSASVFASSASPFRRAVMAAMPSRGSRSYCSKGFGSTHTQRSSYALVVTDRAARDEKGRGKRDKRIFFRVRVAILLAILFGVVLWAAADIRSRRARKNWDH